MSNKPKFKILSIDGGGIKGIIPCVILEFLESQLGSLSETFDLIAGTSTGGIISLGLATPNNDGENKLYANDLLELYLKKGKDIFGSRPTSKTNKVMNFVSKTGKLLTQQPYLSSGLEDLLASNFGDFHLSDCLTDVLVTTYEIERGKTFYFLSREAQNNTSEDFLLRTIARATSAAPTYFKPCLVEINEEQKMAFIDGGVFANNPSVLAYCEGKELFKRRVEKIFSPGLSDEDTLSIQPDDDDYPFYMLSLGTGYSKKSISFSEASSFSTKDWLNPLVQDIFMRSVSESTHFSMLHLLPSYSDKTPRYDRLNFEIPLANSEMDDVSDSNINKLKNLAEKYVIENEDKLLRICDLLS